MWKDSFSKEADYFWSMSRVPGVGNCLFLHASGVENRTSMKKKSQISRCVPGVGGGGGVTARIEPCITIGPVHVRPRRTVRLCRKVPIVATLVTFGISSLWGSLLSGGGHYFQGGRYLRGTKTMKQS